MRGLSTAGERLGVDCAVPRLAALLDAGTGGELDEAPAAGNTVYLKVEADHRPFGRDGWTLIGRGAWANSPLALIADACSSGFDLLVEHGSVVDGSGEPAYRAAVGVRDGRITVVHGETADAEADEHHQRGREVGNVGHVRGDHDQPDNQGVFHDFAARFIADQSLE